MPKKTHKTFDELATAQPPTPAMRPCLIGGPFGLDWYITFGKYHRRLLQLRQIIEIDPDYVQWCIDNIPGFILTVEASNELYLCYDPPMSQIESDPPDEELEF